LCSCREKKTPEQAVKDLESALGVRQYEPNLADISVAKIESITKLPIPSEAKILNLLNLHALDDVFLVKFELEMKRLDKFLANTAFKRRENLSSKRNYCSNFEDISWWNISKINTFLSGSYNRDDGKSNNILIDLANPQKAVVYLQTY